MWRKCWLWFSFNTSIDLLKLIGLSKPGQHGLTSLQTCWGGLLTAELHCHLHVVLSDPAGLPRLVGMELLSAPFPENISYLRFIYPLKLLPATRPCSSGIISFYLFYKRYGNTDVNSFGKVSQRVTVTGFPLYELMSILLWCLSGAMATSMTWD